MLQSKLFYIGVLQFQSSPCRFVGGCNHSQKLMFRLQHLSQTCDSKFRCTPKNKFHYRLRFLCRLIILSTVAAASTPLLPCFPPERSRACSIVSQVKTPNTTGTP